MTLSYDWLKLEEEEPISFVLYGSYEEQMQFLTDEQLGRLIRNVLYYVRTGDQKTEEPIIDMMLSVMANDIRNQKRNMKKRSDAGKAGGEASAKAKEEKNAAAKKTAKKTDKKQSKTSGKKSLNDVERFGTTDKQYVDEDVDVNENVDADGYVDVLNKTSRHPHHSSQRASDGEDASMDEIIPYGENQNLTTRGVIVQMEALAGELIRKYCGRAAYENDVQNVFDKCYTVAELPDGELYAAFSPERAELLRYAFKQAGDAGSVNWKYIEGIYDNFEKRRIKTAEEAIQKEYEWQRGDLSA
ncbi:MAG: DnaD domain protein [Peptococcaceae bacterium]|nr:DnaD domain protein [Peptococcaceae bacterium]